MDWNLKMLGKRFRVLRFRTCKNHQYFIMISVPNEICLNIFFKILQAHFVYGLKAL